jgi:transcriptional regulator with XRE-family HTH domain
MARRKPDPSAWTPNQVVAYRVALARKLRGWTQDQAAAELEPYLGARLSPASFSAIERSPAGGRTRQFDADEIVAFARGFRLPIGWFFTPPPVFEDVSVLTPDSRPHGLPPMLLIDAILGTPETIPDWEGELRLWSAGSSIVRIHADGRMEDLGRQVPDVHDRISDLLRLRASVRATELFGDTATAKQVLRNLAELIDEIDETHVQPHEPARADTKTQETAPDETSRHRGSGKARGAR